MLVNSNYGGFRGDVEFSKVFFRNLVVDASLYMVADYEAVQRKTEELLKRQRICVESIADVPLAAALQPGAWARLRGYMKLADEKGMSGNGQVQERMPHAHHALQLGAEPGLLEPAGHQDGSGASSQQRAL